MTDEGKDDRGSGDLKDEGAGKSALGGGTSGAAPTVVDLDLTAQEDPKNVTSAPPPEVGGKIGEAREKARGYLAMSLVVILGVIVVGALVAFSCGMPIEGLKGLLAIILGPIVALVGSVTGFYFGGLEAIKRN